MVNQAKKSRPFVCNQNRNMPQKQYKCVKLSQVKKFGMDICGGMAK